MLKEFKEFALRGNVVDLAVGVIIGAAFNSLSANVNAANLVDAKKQGAVLAWGNFLTLTINFIIVAFILFLVVKGINTLRRNEAKEPPKPDPASTREELLLMEIRDALKARNV
jgi:large conductance mechanosensitive channel